MLGYSDEGNYKSGDTPADLLPTSTSRPLEKVRFSTVYLTEQQVDPTGIGDDGVSPLTGPVDLTSHTQSMPMDAPFWGVAVTTEQSWRLSGVSLGHLLHSVALAPGESTRVAVVDWSRQTTGSASENTSQTEALSQSLVQSRAVSEIVDTVAREQQHGASTATSDTSSDSWGGSAGFSFLGIGGGGGSTSHSRNHGVATTVSRTSGSRNVSGDALQKIAASTHQHASSARTRRAAIVKEINVKEAVTASTRVLTNYNHMHALSVHYYEVVQDCVVTTKCMRCDPCVFVPMNTVRFDQSILRRYHHLLAAVALPGWAERLRDLDPYAAAQYTTRSNEGGPHSYAGHIETIGSANHHYKFIDYDSSPDGQVWALTSDHRPVKLSWDGKSWDDFSHMQTGWYQRYWQDWGIRKISIGNNGEVWAWNPDKESPVLRYDASKNEWYEPEGGARWFGSVSCCDDGQVWCIYSPDGHLHLWSDAALDPRRVGSFVLKSSTPMAVTAGSSSQVYGVDKTNTLWHFDLTNWTQMGLSGTSPMRCLALSPQNALWGINQNDDLCRYDVAEKTWDVLDIFAGRRKFREISCSGDDKIVGVSVDGDLVRIDPEWLNEQKVQHHAFDERLDSGEARSITVSWDDSHIRGIIIEPRSGTKPITIGEQVLESADEIANRPVLKRKFAQNDEDIGPSPRTVIFDPDERILSITLHSSSKGGGSLTQIEIKTTKRPGGITLGTANRTPGVHIEGHRGLLFGIHGATAETEDGRIYVATLGFHLHCEKVADDLMDHLNHNDYHYSRAIWANADVDTLAAMLSRHSLPDWNPKNATWSGPPIALNRRVDPKPIAVHGNSIGFRWHFHMGWERDQWLSELGLEETRRIESRIGIPTGGVFAEAIQGRANAAEKLDITRFWNWKDSPIQVLPSDIAPVDTGSRNTQLDLITGKLAAPAVQINPAPALPDPVGLTAALQAVSSGNMFRDMSGMNISGDVLKKGIEMAAVNDQEAAKNAQGAMKIATDHMEKMAKMALEAAPMLMGPEGLAAEGGGMSNPSVKGAMHNLGSATEKGGGKSFELPNPPESEKYAPEE